MQSHENLLKTRQAIKQLQEMNRKSDPASGMSFSVRLGVSRDNESVEDDDEKRPWVTVEISSLVDCHRATTALIDGLKLAETFWEKATRRDIEEARKALGEL